MENNFGLAEEIKFAFKEVGKKGNKEINKSRKKCGTAQLCNYGYNGVNCIGI